MWRRKGRKYDFFTFFWEVIARANVAIDFQDELTQPRWLKSERWNMKSTHFIILFTHFKTNTKSIGISRVLRCCGLLKNQNLLRHEMASLTKAHRFLYMMSTLYIPSLWLKWEYHLSGFLNTQILQTLVVLAWKFAKTGDQNIVYHFFVDKPNHLLSLKHPLRFHKKGTKLFWSSF